MAFSLAAPRQAKPKTLPNCSWERSLIETSEGSAENLLIGIDEVGRGAWAGPVAVGLVAVCGSRLAGSAEHPENLADSKQLSRKQRQALIEPILSWADAAAVGYSSAVEVSRYGLNPAQRLAAWRALHRLLQALEGKSKGRAFRLCLLLDGKHDWFTPPAPGGNASAQKKASPACDLFDSWQRYCPGGGNRFEGAYRLEKQPAADTSSVLVAAASVLAKVARDRLMECLDRGEPGYGWAHNAGYGTRQHRREAEQTGLSPQHRSRWKTSADLPLKYPQLPLDSSYEIK